MRNGYANPNTAQAIAAAVVQARAVLARAERALARPCGVCGVLVSSAELRRRRHLLCRPCNSARNRRYVVAYRERSPVPRLPDGVTYRSLRDAQGNVCADCGKPETEPRAGSPTGRPMSLSIHWEERGTNPRLVCLSCLMGE